MTEELDEIVALQRANQHTAPPHRVQQWHASIDEAAAVGRGKKHQRERRWHPGSFFWGMAASAVLALGIFVGLTMSGGDEPVPLLTGSDAPVLHQAAFTRGLATHLRDSHQALAGLTQAHDNTELIMQLIEQNRLFEKAAEQNEARKLARVLRAFETILVRLAATDIAPEDAAQLRDRLAFELNVMLTKLAQETSDQTHST